MREIRQKMVRIFLVSGMFVLCLLRSGIAHAEQKEDEQVYTSGNYEYAINSDGTVTIMDCKSDVLIGLEGLEIPETIDGRIVTGIGDYAFSGYFYGVFMDDSSEIYLEIPDTVTAIGAYAFAYMELQQINIPASVISIGEGAFARAEGFQVASENPVYYQKDGVLFDRSGTLLAYPGGLRNDKYVVPEGTSRIGAFAFAGSYVDYIEIPDSVRSIGEGVFMGSSVSEIVVSDKSAIEFKNNALIDWENKVFLHYVDQEEKSICQIPEGIVRIGTGAFLGCYLEEITIADTVTEIGDWSFASCSLETISLPECLTQVGEYAFAESHLNSVSIPAAVLTIGKGAFAVCDYLQKITVAEENNSYYALDGVLFDREGSLIAYPGAKEGDYYQVPEGITEIGDFAFCGNNQIEKIAFPSSVERLGMASFCGTELSEILFPEGLTEIGEMAFFDCNYLKTIEIPSSVVRIGDGAFYGYWYMGEVEVFIPANLTEMGILAFDYSRLSNLIVSSDNPRYQIRDNAFIDTEQMVFLAYLGSGTGVYTVPDGIEVIGAFAFAGHDELASVYMPATLQSIEAGAFEGCSNIYSLEIPSSVSHIGKMAFSDCDSLSSIWIPKGITVLKEGIFENCGNLQTVTIPSTVVRIESDAFSRCSSLQSISLPANLRTLGSRAFLDCQQLESISTLSMITMIGNSTFSGCSSLKNIEIPNTVTEIGTAAFDGCTSLTTVTVPESVQAIGNLCFLDSGLNYIGVHPDNPVYAQINGVLFDKQKKELVVYPAEKTEILYEIPEGILSVSRWAFYNCRWLSEISISSTVTEIECEFYGCTNLAAFHVAEGNPVYEVWDESLVDKTTGVLKKYPTVKMDESYVIPDGVKEIEYYAFENDNLKQVTIPAGVEYIDNYAFNCNNLSKIIVEKDSFAKAWAEKKGYTFEYIDANSWLNE